MAINVKDIFVEVVTCVNEKTGEMTECPRTVLIDDKGIGYTAVSIGVFSSLKKIFAIFGEPKSWTEPVVLTPKLITKGTKQITILDIA
jgi:hypothetical protein